jgi:ERCC4-related helicase
MSEDIIDNSKVKMLDVLKDKLSISRKARFAVGWLFLSGFENIRNEIDGLEKLEILAGARTNKQTVEAMLLEKKYEKAVKDILAKKEFLPEDERKKLLEEEFKGIVENLSSMEPNENNVSFLKWLWENISQKKIEIRIYHKAPLHAKLYLFDYKDKKHGEGEAIVGSSNLSLGGLETKTELNVRVLGDDNFNQLNQWFEERWQESKLTEFSPLAQKAIEQSWAFNNEVTPFKIYLKVLHEIFSYKEPEPEIELETELYRFQRDAVIDAYRRLKKYNGVFISDVPGLGKTYIGAALLSHLETEGKPALVVAPPRLVEYWRDILANFGASKARVISSGKIEEAFENESYLKKKVVLVDESHHFRNPETKRYRDLAKICEGKEVILVSATPQNLNIWDIYWQLKLFTPYEANHRLRIYPVEIKRYFDACDKGEANIDDLISQIFIRRTRSDIKEFYPDERIYFPARKGPYRVDYSIDKVYEGGLYDKLKKLISRLRYARYNLGKYAKKEEFDPDELQRLTVAWENLKRLVQINLFRRLESSIQAFKDSIDTHLKVHHSFKKILEDENKVWIGELDDLEDIIEKLENGDEVEWVERENYYDADKFDKGQLSRDLASDIEIFELMKNYTSNLKAENDDKLLKLIELLKSDELLGKKIIIFSCFESTVKYLYENVNKILPKVDYIAGGKGLYNKIKRFAPVANKAKIRPEEEIKVLITTEVLSEGLNLQDGQVIINYELHWNPVRIIQRIGRIDRISSKHDEIYVYNFFPETQAEKQIKIEDKVNRRIDEIIHNFGYDEKTINLDEPTVRKKLFEIYTEKPEGTEEPEEQSSPRRFELEFKKLTSEYPEEYQKAIELPAMTNVARSSEAKGLITFCRADDYYRLRHINGNGELISADDWKILGLLKCGVNEPGQKIDHKYYQLAEISKKEFEVEANKREQDKKFVTDPVKKEFEQLIKWMKRREPNEIQFRFNNLLSFVKSKQLNLEQTKFLRAQTRSYKNKFGMKKIDILNELEAKIRQVLKDAPEIKLPDIEPKYAQIVVFEELR